MKNFIPAPKVRKAFDITPMTEYRWRRKGQLPRPKVINGRNYYSEDELYAMHPELQEGVA